MYKKVGINEMKRLTEETLRKEMHNTFHKAIDTSGSV